MITPSFCLTATERVLPRLALDFTTAALDSRITFTRTTGASNPATYVNSSGVITAATNNQPRFDYDPVTLACKGLLIEEQRSNSLQRSEALNTSPWNITNSTVSTTGGTSPANTNTANLITDNATSGVHGVAVFNAWPSGVQSTLSVYVKAGTLSKVAIGNASTGGYSYFDLATGTNVANATGFTGTITQAGNGWYRITATHTSSANQTLGIFSYVNVGNPSYVGTGQNFYAWGAQLEAGAFATSYIPTTTTALTRNADVATMTGTNFSDWFNASEGTFTFQGVNYDISTTRVILDATDGTLNDRLQLSTASNKYFMADGGATQANFGTGTITANTAYKMAAAYKANDLAFAINGAATQTDNTATLPTLNQMTIGTRAVFVNTNQYSGWLQKLNYYPQRLTNAQVQAFSK